jgi:hypothetical protein
MIGKKGMEMWQLVIMVLLLILLVVVLSWYGGLGSSIKGLLGKLTNLL